jgi:hypothetical protein
MADLGILAAGFTRLRMIPNGHSAAWTYAAKALTFWLRVKRREFIRLIGGAATA